MNKEKETFVLAFFPNSRGFGYAFMQNAITLKDYQIVTSNPISNKKLLKKIYGYIEYYAPDIVVLENTNGRQSRKGKRNEILIKSISKYAKAKNIKTVFYSREEIKFVFSQFEAKTKYEISKTISNSIPELKKLIKPKKKLWEAEPYSQGIFDAVSLGITHYFSSL